MLNFLGRRNEAGITDRASLWSYLVCEFLRRTCSRASWLS
jgi:hypothetical protein